MRPRMWCVVARLWLALAPLAVAADLNAKPAAKDEGSAGCGSYGTAVDFVDSPSAAARQALKEEKLVLVLHVSGHFEDSGVT